MTVRPRLAEATHVVYGCHAADDRVLYVGCTHDLERRTWEHQTNTRWWSDVARVEILATRPTGAEGRAAETDLIRRLRPAYNQQRRLHRSKWTLDDYLGSIAGAIKQHPDGVLCCDRHMRYLREVKDRFGVSLATGSGLLDEIERMLTREPVANAT